MNDKTLTGLTDGTFRARWLREVFRTPHITESVKLMLVAMAIEEMDDAGRVSVPREVLAVRIGRGKARISERVQEAVTQGLLVRVSAGKKGSTAVYAAAVKGSACADPGEEFEDQEKGPATRTESEHFGSGLQDAEPETKGPPIRTETMFGSGLQDAIDGGSVRVAGPNDAIKGPATRAAKVEGYREEVELPQDSADDDFLKTEEAASRRAPQKPKRSKQVATPKFPLPADFAPDEAMRAWAREKCPLVDIDTQHELFMAHFTPEPGETPVKRPGWGRSWKTWMVRQQGWAKDRMSNVRQLRPTGTDSRFTPGSGAHTNRNTTYSENPEDVFGP